MSNIYGRQVVVPLTNKSGGGVIAGDVVIVDTSNNEAFTTTTTAGYTGGVGIAQETIANNATGRVLLEGYAALVLTSASVTRGDYGKTHTVAKQAVSAGASRGAGTFVQFLTGGTTPTGRVFAPDLAAAAGNVASDAIWDAAGDLAVGSGADTAARLAIGATNGMALRRVSGAVAWAFPPGHELAYVEFTSPVSSTATTEAGADSVVSAGAVTFDGSTRVLIEWYMPYVVPVTGANAFLALYDGSGSIGKAYQASIPSGVPVFPVSGSRILTPSNASHTYSIRSWTGSAGTISWGAGAGGSGNYMPGYIRITVA